MEARVGGRLETVIAPPITDTSDRLWLGALLILAVVVHVWLIQHTYVTARDSVGFARLARQLGEPSKSPRNPAQPDKVPTFTDAISHANFMHPPGYPLAVWFTSQIVRRVYQPESPSLEADQMLLSTQVASAIGGVLLVLPMYWMGRKLFGKFVGFAAAALFQVLPVPANVTADGLTEGVYLLGLATTLMLGVRAIGGPTIGRFLLCGLATGCTYLIRPEGLFWGLPVALVAGAMVVRKQWHWRPTSAYVTAMAVGMMLPAAPYMALIGGVSKKPGMDNSIKSLRELIINGSSGTGSLPQQKALFASFYVAGEDGPKVLWAAGTIVGEAAKSFLYIPGVLALIGLYSLRRRLREDPQLWVLLTFIGLNLAALATLALKGGYVSERHTLPLVMVGLLFAGVGLEAVGRRIGSWLRFPGQFAAAGLLVLVAVASLPATLKPLHPQRLGHKLIGHYLKEHIVEGDMVIDPDEWADYYAGRSLYGIPPDPHPDTHPRVWVVMTPPSGDPKVDFHPQARGPRYEAALNVVKDPRTKAVMQWPDEPGKKVRVILYCREIE